MRYVVAMSFVSSFTSHTFAEEKPSRIDSKATLRKAGGYYGMARFEVKRSPQGCLQMTTSPVGKPNNLRATHCLHIFDIPVALN